jgi:hypothetical protein
VATASVVSSGAGRAGASSAAINPLTTTTVPSVEAMATHRLRQ